MREELDRDSETLNEAEQAEREFAEAFDAPASVDEGEEPERPEAPAGAETEANATARSDGRQAEGEEGQEEEPTLAKGAEGTEQADEEPDEQRRKAQLLAATEGRLRKVQEELAALRQQVAERERGQVQDLPQAHRLEDLPEELREDVQAFVSANPELAQVALERSRRGDRLRRAIAEYGPEHVLVEDMAERAAAESRTHSDTLRARQEEQAAVSDAHFSAIFQAHPDFAKVCAVRDTNPGAFEDYRARLDAWSEEKPGKEYKQIQRALNNGTAIEVIEVLNQYKQDKADRVGARRDDTRRRAADATVPPSRPSPSPKLGEADQSGSFEEGWSGAK